MTIYYNNSLDVKEIVEEVDVDKKISLKGAYINTSPHVTYTQLSNIEGENELITLQNNSHNKSVPILLNEVNKERWEKLDSDILKLNLDIDLGEKINGAGKLKADLKYYPTFKVAFNSKKNVARFDFDNLSSQNIEFEYSRKDNKKKKLENFKYKIAEIILPSSYGLNYPIDVFFYSDLSGELKVGAEFKQEIKFSAKVDKDGFTTKNTQEFENNLHLSVSGTEKFGVKPGIGVDFFQYDIMKIYLSIVEFEINGEAKLDLLWDVNKPKDVKPIETQFSLSRNMKAGVTVDAFDILKSSKKNYEKGTKKIIRPEEFEYEKTLYSLEVYNSTQKNKIKKKEVDNKKKAEVKSDNVDYNLLYKKIFDFYSEINNFAINNGDKTSDEFINLMDNSFEISSWEIEAFMSEPDRYYYYFKDLNQDDIKELIIAKRTNDANTNMFITGVYYLDGEMPELLAQGYVAGNGGGRASITFLDNGDVYSLSWMSGTGLGEAIKYRIANGNRNIISKEEISNYGEFTIRESYTELFDYQTVPWQKFKTVAKEAIPKNLIGTWSGVDNGGNEILMTFSSNGNLKTVHNGIESTAKISRIKTVAPNSFEYILVDSYGMVATSPGTNIGGVGIKYTTGYKIEGEHLQPLIWEASVNEEFNYFEPLEHYNIKLKKIDG